MKTLQEQNSFQEMASVNLPLSPNKILSEKKEKARSFNLGFLADREKESRSKLRAAFHPKAKKSAMGIFRKQS